MIFYDREDELAVLENIRRQSEQAGRLTVISGRRRIGKSALILESLKGQKHLYLFALREDEALLCARFQEEAEKALGLTIFGTANRFGELFGELLRYAERTPFTLVIDEFQEMGRINPAVYGEIQNLWDLHKKTSRLNFIVCGSAYSLMTKIFEDDKEPLFGRADSRIVLQPFKIAVLKTILKDHNKNFKNEDLLCLYMLTGGIPKYVELLMDCGAVTFAKMINRVCTMDSPFLNDGRDLLIGEFGRDYGVYFSILQLVAAGKTSQPEIDFIIGKSSGAYLANLERDYSLIVKNKPVFSRPESRNTRWKIADQYLRFYFRFILPNQGLIETNRFQILKEIIVNNYETYSGRVLEDYFRRKLAEETGFLHIDGFWDKKGENEIDIVAVGEGGGTPRALVAEVKRNAKKLNMNTLMQKAAALSAELAPYQAEYQGFSLEDM